MQFKGWEVYRKGCNRKKTMVRDEMGSMMGLPGWEFK